MEDNDRVQQPWSRPFGMGQQDYLITLTGQQPTHYGPHFP